MSFPHYNIDPAYLLLAYAGACVHLLFKLEDDRQKISGFDLVKWIKHNSIMFVVTMITIPLILIMVKGGLSDTLPINNVTAVLAGYQTNSVFKSLMLLGGSKLPKNDPPTPPVP